MSAKVSRTVLRGGERGDSRTLPDWWGLVKFWLMPWLVYHFWMSTFTLVHHTGVDVQFTPASEWNEAMAQLAGTIHCDYPLQPCSFEQKPD